ncbi:MAG: oligogalacturonate lyase family protein [Chloroflexaceae bacterium]|jgi:oligogalacturonide lyase|nr:oligogalacturonate lyase family protein [Chloroflexaceae bacterium]
MIGRTWPAEGRTLHDESSGRTMRQLTSVGHNVHLYFTDNAFNQGGDSIVFLSDRGASERRPAHQAHYNLFRMELGSGEITQLTDEAEPVFKATKTPDGRLLAYVVGNQVKLLDSQSGSVTVVHEERDGFTLGRPSISADGRFVGFDRNEPGADRGPNYSGFKERYYGIKDGRIMLAHSDGTGSFEIYRDTCQLAHFQFSPVDPTMALFCHEGPWHLVTQRIWLLDTVSRTARPAFRQGEQDSVGHEFWTMDGNIFFDNRGPGHDGTITSQRTQAVASEVSFHDHSGFQPYVGLLDGRGRLLRTFAMPFACNHYHANPAGTMLAGDDVDAIILIDISGETAQITPLWTHGTSWVCQESHCHPTWSWDGRRLLVASDRDGQVQLYLLEL